jgi:hypothetical protein
MLEIVDRLASTPNAKARSDDEDGEFVGMLMKIFWVLSRQAH